MLGAYLPILLLVIVAIGFGLVSLVASSLIGPPGLGFTDAMSRERLSWIELTQEK